jgi:hypothetical protein
MPDAPVNQRLSPTMLHNPPPPPPLTAPPHVQPQPLPQC